MFNEQTCDTLGSLRTGLGEDDGPAEHGGPSLHFTWSNTDSREAAKCMYIVTPRIFQKLYEKKIYSKKYNK